jgi:hypothetical protein
VRGHVAALIDAAIFVANTGSGAWAAAVGCAIADFTARALAVGCANAREVLAEHLEKERAGWGARRIDRNAAARVGCANVIGDERPLRLAWDATRGDVVPLAAHLDGAGVRAVDREE